MTQAVGWTAKSRIARQEITCLEVTWKLINLFVTKLPPDSILYEINPVYTFSSGVSESDLLHLNFQI